MRNDYLGMYLKNLDKLRSLPIELGLPGHRALILDCHKRIDELKEHHKRRLDLVLKILEDGGRYNAAQVAKQMRWDIRAKSWEDFPPAQKYFAAGEALSHLTHLVFQDSLNSRENAGVRLGQEAPDLRCRRYALGIPLASLCCNRKTKRFDIFRGET